MLKYGALLAGVVGLCFAGTAHAADVDGFRSARFGIDEKAVVKAAVSDLGIKATALKRQEDAVTKVTTLTAKVKSFAPLNLPATITYVLGYQCKCLVQAAIVWDFPAKIKLDDRKTAMAGVAALVDRFANQKWGKDEAVTARVTGDVKEGSENVIVFFRGQNKKGGAITLAGAPVKMMSPSKKKGEPLAANVDELKTVSLAYEKDAVNPDIYRVDVSGF